MKECLVCSKNEKEAKIVKHHLRYYPDPIYVWLCSKHHSEAHVYPEKRPYLDPLTFGMTRRDWKLSEKERFKTK